MFPLSMPIDAPSIPIVDVGNWVKIGTLIAEKQDMTSVNSHSSI
ncbi:hypothetical protein ACS127_09635 [Amphibacillus sp. Q70]